MINGYSIKQGTFSMKTYGENVQQKAVSDLFLILMTVQNSQYMQETLLKIRYFERGLPKNVKNVSQKVNLTISFAPSLFMDKIIKNNSGMELVANLSLGCKTCS